MVAVVGTVDWGRDGVGESPGWGALGERAGKALVGWGEDAGPSVPGDQCGHVV